MSNDSTTPDPRTLRAEKNLRDVRALVAAGARPRLVEIAALNVQQRREQQRHETEPSKEPDPRSERLRHEIAATLASGGSPVLAASTERSRALPPLDPDSFERADVAEIVRWHLLLARIDDFTRRTGWGLAPVWQIIRRDADREAASAAMDECEATWQALR